MQDLRKEAWCLLILGHFTDTLGLVKGSQWVYTGERNDEVGERSTLGRV